MVSPELVTGIEELGIGNWAGLGLSQGAMEIIPIQRGSIDYCIEGMVDHCPWSWCCRKNLIPITPPHCTIY